MGKAICKCIYRNPNITFVSLICILGVFIWYFAIPYKFEKDCIITVQEPNSHIIYTYKGSVEWCRIMGESPIVRIDNIYYGK